MALVQQRLRGAGPGRFDPGLPQPRCRHGPRRLSAGFRFRYRARLRGTETPRPMSARLVALSLLLAAGLGACAPAVTQGNATAARIGMAAPVGYGTIIGMAPAQVQAPSTGAGALMGGLAGGIIGSAIGGDWRARTVAMVGGWLIGAGLGAAAESGLGRGPAVQFLIRPEDGGPDYLVVQTNEQVLQVGERVAVSFGDRVTLQRMATVPTADASPRRNAAIAAPAVTWKN